jgi:hypothetical protein
VRRMTLWILALFLAGAVAGFAAETTLTGKISDDMCGASHKGMEHAGKQSSDRDCTLACVKGGSKYVFVSEGMVYAVENQSFAGLKEHAGHTVKLTGDVSADKKSVKVSKIEMSGEGKKKPAY